ncbi:Chromodomain Y-like protein 2 [Exaiptasia diaphana]|nr:Chromodomain Y-like protein 2 [Exaiptasia diaphana]
MLVSQRLDVLFLVDTFLKPNETDSVYALQGYEIHRRDRGGETHGGGVLAFVKSGLKPSRDVNVEDKDIELLWLNYHVKAHERFYKDLLTNDFGGSDLKSKYIPKPKVTYEVERVVARRQSSKIREYFIKWKDYSSSENTWEPESHLSEQLVTEFANPTVDAIRIDELKERLVAFIKTVLKSKAMDCNEIMIQRHGVVRCLFHRIPADIQAPAYEISEQEL